MSMTNKNKMAVKFLLEFRNDQGQQASIVGTIDGAWYAAYWPLGRVKHHSIYKCIAVLECLGYSVVTDTFTI